MRETRWIAQFRPALVGADTWCFETLDPAITGRHVSPCHQELMVRFGIRLGLHCDAGSACAVALEARESDPACIANPEVVVVCVLGSRCIDDCTRLAAEDDGCDRPAA